MAKIDTLSPLGAGDAKLPAALEPINPTAPLAYFFLAALAVAHRGWAARAYPHARFKGIKGIDDAKQWNRGIAINVSLDHSRPFPKIFGGSVAISVRACVGLLTAAEINAAIRFEKTPLTSYAEPVMRGVVHDGVSHSRCHGDASKPCDRVAQGTKREDSRVPSNRTFLRGGAFHGARGTSHINHPEQPAWRPTQTVVLTAAGSD